MANRWRQYSWADQQNYLRRLRVILTWVLVFFLVHAVISALIVSNRVVETDTMRPGFEAGDRCIFQAFTVQHLFRDRNAGYLPFKRGQVVLVDRSVGIRRPFLRIIFDGLVRFFTLQRYSLFPKDDTLFVKRVIGLPGDTVTINNYVVRIKPAGEQYEYTEFELSNTDYTPELPQVSPLWDESLPFSGFMDTITLKSEECFVLSDDRSVTNDSRTWGPVPSNSITGRVVLRYWPITRFQQL
jgi:signal peptidase I